MKPAILPRMTEIRDFSRVALVAALTILAAFPCSGQQSRTGIINLDQPHKPTSNDSGSVAPSRESRTGIINLDPSPKASNLPPGVSYPKIVSRVYPEFSEEARKQHIEGTVLLSVLISDKGEIAKVELVKGLGYGLDENAIEAVRQWKFQPAQKDGQPVAVNVTVEVAFHLYNNR